MKCPKCGREMVAGYLQCDMDSNIYWVSKLLPFGFGNWKKDSVVVSEMLDHCLTAVPSHICKQCKLVLGDYSQKK